jgi:hypothetical protein
MCSNEHYLSTREAGTLLRHQYLDLKQFVADAQCPTNLQGEHGTDDVGKRVKMWRSLQSQPPLLFGAL